MSKSSKSSPEVRNLTIKVPVNADEKEEIEHRAAKVGWSTAAYLRWVGKGNVPPVVKESK